MNGGIYQTCYELVAQYVYGGSAQLESYQDLVCVAVSTLACLFVIALPFILVWRVIKLLGGR